jgi:hypothetical protein
MTVWARKRDAYEVYVDIKVVTWIVGVCDLNHARMLRLVVGGRWWWGVAVAPWATASPHRCLSGSRAWSGSDSSWWRLLGSLDGAVICHIGRGELVVLCRRLCAYSSPSSLDCRRALPCRWLDRLSDRHDARESFDRPLRQLCGQLGSQLV